MQSIDILVPCRNEAGNMRQLLEDILNNSQEIDNIIFIEGGSIDGTWKEILDLIDASKNTNLKAIKQSKKGKFNAILSALPLLESQKVLIWDSDNTISPTDNGHILELTRRTGEVIITGDRLCGERTAKSMKNLNLIGNFTFSILWSLSTFQKPIDVLCGTKSFPSKILKIMPNVLQEKDTYGDISYLAVARKMKLPRINIPVKYLPRQYGNSKIPPFSGGINLLRAWLYGTAYLWANRK